MDKAMNSKQPEEVQARWEDFSFYLLTLRRHYHPEEMRAYVLGVSPDDAHGRKAIRLTAWRTLLWELTKEQSPQQYGEWYLEREEKQP